MAKPSAMLLLLLVMVQMPRRYWNAIVSIAHNGTDSPACLDGTVNCKSLPYIAENSDNHHDLVIDVVSPVVSLETTANFSTVSNVTIQSHTLQGTSEIICTYEDQRGIAFYNSTMIT